VKNLIISSKIHQPWCEVKWKSGYGCLVSVNGGKKSVNGLSCWRYCI